MQNPRRSRQPPTAINHGTMNRGSTGIQTKECSPESSKKITTLKKCPKVHASYSKLNKKKHTAVIQFQKAWEGITRQQKTKPAGSRGNEKTHWI